MASGTIKTKMIDKIIGECFFQGINNLNAVKYILATVEHETNGTFMPVKEAYWLSEHWRELHLRYYPFYGRGLVQITWETNYKKFSQILTDRYECEYIDLVKNPDLALDETFATVILVYGMKHGTFTGKKLDDYFTDKDSYFVGARRIINGVDKAAHIAGLAMKINIG